TWTWYSPAKGPRAASIWYSPPATTAPAVGPVCGSVGMKAICPSCNGWPLSATFPLTAPRLDPLQPPAATTAPQASTNPASHRRVLATIHHVEKAAIRNRDLPALCSLAAPREPGPCVAAGQSEGADDFAAGRRPQRLPGRQVDRVADEPGAAVTQQHLNA